MGAHEKATLSKVAPLLQSASLFVDAGASLGQYTKLANECMRNGTIIAVEADPIRFEELERNCKKWAQGSTNTIKPIHSALTNVPGPITFHTTESNISGGLFQHEVENAKVSWKEITVKGLTLDEICATRSPDLIKMDIEGGELRALRGAKRILADRSVHTRLLVEVHSWAYPEGQKNPQQVFAYMKSLGHNYYPVGGSFLFDRGLGVALRQSAHRIKRIPQKLQSLMGR